MKKFLVLVVLISVFAGGLLAGRYKSWVYPLKSWASSWNYHTPPGDVRQAEKRITCKNGRQGHLYHKKGKYFCTDTSYQRVTQIYDNSNVSGDIKAVYEFCGY